jgi:phosphate uptake regulator
MSTWTQADVDSLKAAVASGILTVRFDGPPSRMITYQSLREMRDLLASMLSDVASSQGKASYILASTRKGL